MATTTPDVVATTTELSSLKNVSLDSGGGDVQPKSLMLLGGIQNNGYICVLYSDSNGTCAYYQSTTTPLFVQDAGNVTFGLAIIISLLMFVFVAFLFNSFGGSKRKRL